jgi:hypothetical protein
VVQIWRDWPGLFTHKSDPVIFESPCNYRATAYPHTLQITAGNTKSPPNCSVFNSLALATASNSAHSSGSRAQVLWSQPPVQNSSQLSTELERNLFLASLAEISWTANPQLTQFHSAVMGSSLYSPRTDPTENNAPHSSSIFVMAGCLEIARILCLPAVIKQRMFLLVIFALQRYYTFQ